MNVDVLNRYYFVKSQVSPQSSKGFVDCLYTSCLERYGDKYKSLLHVNLVDLLVQPVPFRKRLSSGSNTDVILKVSVSDLGEYEFRKRSRSIIYSSFSTILSAFEFYINCQKAFECLTFAIEDAKKRNRGDIISSCKYKLSELTSVNKYEKI